MSRMLMALCVLLGWAMVGGAQTPGVIERDFVIGPFRFASAALAH